jgi:hypothetical protein
MRVQVEKSPYADMLSRYNLKTTLTYFDAWDIGEDEFELLIEPCLNYEGMLMVAVTNKKFHDIAEEKGWYIKQLNRLDNKLFCNPRFVKTRKDYLNNCLF